MEAVPCWAEAVLSTIKVQQSTQNQTNIFITSVRKESYYKMWGLKGKLSSGRWPQRIDGAFGQLVLVLRVDNFDGGRFLHFGKIIRHFALQRLLDKRFLNFRRDL